ncbi:MAG: NTP transferase domain-containing protein [Pseudomonadota bacterium]
MTVAGVLLAAGTSSRFGGADKLLSTLHGSPLVSYAANALRTYQPDVRIAVVRSNPVAALLTDFDCVQAPEDEPLQADSLRAGVSRAMRLGANQIIVVLGDMPFVTASLLAEVAGLCTETRPSASSDGDRIMPPACFPKALFPKLLNLKGDHGAAVLVQGLPKTALARFSARDLLDVDTTDALEELHGGAGCQR